MNDLLDFIIFYCVYKLCSVLETNCRETVQALKETINRQNKRIKALEEQLE